MQTQSESRTEGGLNGGEESEDPHLFSFMHRVFAGNCPKIGCPEHHGNYSWHNRRWACSDNIRFSCSLRPLPQSDHFFALSPVRVQTSDAFVNFKYHEQ